MFNIKDLEFKYHKKNIINGISTSFKNEALTSILGPNGSGKTTFLKIIMRFLKNKKGSITVDGKCIHIFKSKEYARKVAYIPQQISFPVGTTVFDFISYGRNPHTNVVGLLSEFDKEKVKSALELCDIANLQNDYINLLSGGQRQLCAIALAIAQDADTIILDEPNSYLDIYHVDEIMNILKKLTQKHKKTVILTIHDINQASKFSDYILMMSNGKIIDFNTPLKVINVKNLKETFSVDVNIQIMNKKPIIVDYVRDQEDHAKKDQLYSV